MYLYHKILASQNFNSCMKFLKLFHTISSYLLSLLSWLYHFNFIYYNSALVVKLLTFESHFMVCSTINIMAFVMVQLWAPWLG